MAKPQQCIYHEGKPAVGLDLCHAGHPVCADHLDHLGHQIAPLPEPEPEPKKASGKR